MNKKPSNDLYLINELHEISNSVKKKNIIPPKQTKPKTDIDDFIEQTKNRLKSIT